jgi:hypothetical protein
MGVALDRGRRLHDPPDRAAQVQVSMEPATIITDLLLMEVADFPLMRKLLLGLRDRAERHAKSDEPQPEPPTNARSSAASHSPARVWAAGW